jgi:hypothetical protein
MGQSDLKASIKIILFGKQGRQNKPVHPYTTEKRQNITYVTVPTSQDVSRRAVKYSVPNAIFMYAYMN